MSESDAVDALRLPFYSSSHPTGSHGWRNQFDLGNPDSTLSLRSKMIRKFNDAIAKMPDYLKCLKSCPLLPMEKTKDRRSLRGKLPAKGIYVLYENDTAMYTGRSENLVARVLEHGRSSSRPESTPFAFEIAKGTLRKACPDSKEWKTKDFHANDKFARHFEEAKIRVGKMGVRAVSIDCPIEQTIFEVYAALALGTCNSFHTS